MFGEPFFVLGNSWNSEMIGLDENFKHEKYVYILYCVYYIYIYVTLRIIDIDKKMIKTF